MLARTFFRYGSTASVAAAVAAACGCVLADQHGHAAFASENLAEEDNSADTSPTDTSADNPPTDTLDDEPKAYPDALKEAIEKLRAQEAEMRKRWKKDETDKKWRKMPPRAWPPKQPLANAIPGLRAKLKELRCPPSMDEPKVTDVRPSGACAATSFHLATALVFRAVDAEEGYNRFRHLAYQKRNGDQQEVKGDSSADDIFLDSFVAVGVMLVGGLGVEEDVPMGVNFLRLASDRGSAQAHYELATLLYCGMDVEEDEEKAFELFEMAANQGHIGGLFMTADMLIDGRFASEPADMQRAVSMLSLAAEKGHRFARQRIREMWDQFK